MGLAGGGVKSDLGATAEAHAVWRDDDGAGQNLMAWVMFWNGADGDFDLVPLLFLDGEEELHKVSADGEVGGVAGDDEGFEVADGVRGRFEGLGDERDDVAAEGVHLGVELDGSDAVPEVDERGAGVLFDDAVRFLEGGEGGGAFGSAELACRCWWWDRKVATGGGGGVVLVPGGTGLGDGVRVVQKLSTLGLTAAPMASILYVVARGPAASIISKGPSSQLKPVFMAWSISTTVAAGSLSEAETRLAA